MDKNKLFGEKYFFLRLGVCTPWKKSSQKIRNFEIFFDINDNHTCTHMHVQKNFKIFRFLAKFLNFLEGPPIEFFHNRFFSTNLHGQTKIHWNFGCVLTFGLEPLSRELCLNWILKIILFDNCMKLDHSGILLCKEWANYEFKKC